MQPSGPSGLGGQPTVSPRKPGVGIVQNHSTMKHVSAENTREAIAEELRGHLQFDRAEVFDRIGIKHVSVNFAKKCAAELNKDTATREAKATLEAVVAAAHGTTAPKKKKPNAPPQIDPANSEEQEPKVEEKKMYKPLMTIFDFIRNFDDGNPRHRGPFNNAFQSTDKVAMKSDGTIYGFPKSSPDFTVLDFSYNDLQEHNGKYSVLWRHQSAFCEVKPTEQQGPYNAKPRHEDNVKPLVAQAADYARLHLSARPFQLFSVGLLIFGSQFCLAIFDREGVTFSPALHMWDDLEQFVCVIRCLTRHASPQHFGLDPTVKMVPYAEHREWVKHVKEQFKLLLNEPVEYPTFLVRGVSEVGFGDRYLLTIGRPIWTSLSFLGRGTVIWLVADKTTGQVFILKTSWRKSNRISESQIYITFAGAHPALAQFEAGGDVFESNGRPVTVKALRERTSPQGAQPNRAGPDTVLHRLLLRSYGRSVIEWRTMKELLQAVRDAVLAHEYLWTQMDILHRDVSAGNVMIAEKLPGDTNSPNISGFLMDVEFARLPQRTFDQVTRHAVPAIRRPHQGGLTSATERTLTKFGQTVLRGGIMTGTAHFMSSDALETMTFVGDIEFVHQPWHDLESFVYVLLYGISAPYFLDTPKRRLSNIRPDELKSAKKFFDEAFSRTSIRDLYRNRKGLGPFDPLKQVYRYLPPVVVELVKALEQTLKDYWSRPSDTFTHAFVLGKLNVAIAAIR